MATDTEQTTATNEDASEASGQNGQGQGQGNQKARAGIYFQAPSVLRERIDAEAQEAGKTPAVFVRDLLAQRYGVELPAAQTRTKYANADERKAAQTAARKSRQELIKQLLEAHKAAQAGKPVEVAGVVIEPADGGDDAEGDEDSA